ncbi:MAG: glycosyltransferase family 2 protein [Microbacteriaceae bacterium]
MAARNSAPNLDVTVIIPTFNGERYLGRILDALREQDTDAGFEVLVVDSGSTDATLDIVAARVGALGEAQLRLHQIPNSEFGHGRTRNLAAQLARGRVLVYLSHDAVPLGANWLTTLIQPLTSSTAQAVVARHIARPHCPPLLKYEIEAVFDRCGPRDRVSLERLSPAELAAIDSVADLDARSFYSDVASATTREFLLSVIPYQDISYSEDFAFGHDVLVGGYAKAYTPLAPVEHSNDVTFAEYGKRIFDETLGRRRIGQERSSLSWAGAMARAVKGSMKDAPRIARDPDYSLGAKLHWLFVNPFWQVRKWSNIRRAISVRFDDAHAIARYSLEAERARRSAST